MVTPFKLGAIAILGALSAWGGLLMSERGEARAASDPRTAVIVELFSSEGCSSCPPADAYLSALDRTQPIDGVSVIALEEHVDYWDDLGWRDPFGRPDFGQRQRQYARALPDTRVYTPEIVIDGHLVMPGGDEGRARQMMQQSAREPKARVAVTRAGARLVVDVTDAARASGDEGAEVWLAVTESGLVTDVGRGENAGHKLAHAPVVRRLRSLGRVTGGAFHAETSLDAEPSWRASALRAVVFVQLVKSRRIVGAALTPSTT